MRYQFTSESVTKGHPDKIADQISDSILDAILSQDPYSRCAAETTVEENRCHIMGEVTTKADVDYVEVARKTIESIGYTDPDLGFWHGSPVSVTLHTQSPDIAMGVDALGAGDQGMMFGYATDETENLMPMALTLARNLTERLTYLRESGECAWMRPDGKSQVTLLYEDGKVRGIDAVVVSANHRDTVTLEDLRAYIMEEVIRKTLPADLLSSATKYYINPTGRFVIGGPAGDTGLTGRKIIVDTYGGYAHHGGGAFSGKDATKVDRSAAYAARNIAATIVKAGAAKRCEVQLSYAIGVREPISVFVDTFSTGEIDSSSLEKWILSSWDLSPKGIIDEFSLRTPIFSRTASSGHFGHPDFPWEKIREERVRSLRAL